jgi:autotransporter-associated beta strand protein
MESGMFSAVLDGTGIALNKTTAGTVTLFASNSYTGPTTITEGMLAEELSGAIANTSNLTVKGRTAIFSFRHDDTVGTVTLQDGGTISSGDASALTVSAGRTFEMQDGTVTATLAGTGIPLNKTTPGTVTLFRGTYTGPTMVSGGKLFVTGLITASAVTVINAGSTLGGTGAVGDVAIGRAAILQGGFDTAASGALTSSGAISLGDGSIIKLTLGPDQTHSSVRRAGGIWVFDDNQAFDFTILPGVSSGTYDDVISGLTGAEVGLESIDAWFIQTPGWVGTFSYDGAGGVDLELNVIPEPRAFALLLAGLLLLQRRKQRSARRSRAMSPAKRPQI